MKPLVIACCEDIIRDSESQAITLYNLIEEIAAEGFPVFIPKFALFVLTQKEDGDKEKSTGLVKLLSNEKEIFSAEIQFDFQGKERLRNNIKIGGIAVPEPGKFKIQILCEGKLLGEYIISSILISPPKAVQS